MILNSMTGPLQLCALLISSARISWAFSAMGGLLVRAGSDALSTADCWYTGQGSQDTAQREYAQPMLQQRSYA